MKSGCAIVVIGGVTAAAVGTAAAAVAAARIAAASSGKWLLLSLIFSSLWLGRGWVIWDIEKGKSCAFSSVKKGLFCDDDVGNCEVVVGVVAGVDDDDDDAHRFDGNDVDVDCLAHAGIESFVLGLLLAVACGDKVAKMLAIFGLFCCCCGDGGVCGACDVCGVGCCSCWLLIFWLLLLLPCFFFLASFLDFENFDHFRLKASFVLLLCVGTCHLHKNRNSNNLTVDYFFR